MDRSHAEVTGIISELDNQGFDALYARDDKLAAYVRSEFDVTGGIDPRTQQARSSPFSELEVVDPIYTKEFKVDVERLKAKLAKDLEVHFEPETGKARDEARADDFEDVCASWIVRSDPAGQVRPAIHFAQAVRMFAPVWAEVTEYANPTRRKGESDSDYNDRCDEYRKTWFGVRLAVDPVRTTKFLDSQRRVTLASREMRVPWIDVARAYGDYDRAKDRGGDEERALLLEICGTQFRGFRGAEAVAEGSASPSSTYATVKVIDDGVWATHHLSGIGRDGSEQVGSYRNPFGRPALWVVSGIYNAGEPLHRRYEPFYMALLEAYRNYDHDMSVLASYIASAPLLEGIVLPPEIAAIEANKKVEERWQPRGKTQVFLGPPMTPMKDVIPLVQRQIETHRETIERLRVSSLFTGPDAGKVLTNSTASGILQAVKEENEMLAPVVESEVLFWREYLQALRHMHLRKINDHYKPGSKAKSKDDKPVYVRVGAGPARGKGRDVAVGKEIELSPADLDVDGTLTVTPLSTDLASATARSAEARARFQFQPRMITYAELIEEHGHTNPTEYAEKLAEDELFQSEVPRVREAQRKHFANYWAAFLGTSPMYIESLYMQAVPQPAMGGGGGETGGPGRVQMMEPYVEPPMAESQGTM